MRKLIYLRQMTPPRPILSAGQTVFLFLLSLTKYVSPWLRRHILVISVSEIKHCVVNGTIESRFRTYQFAPPEIQRHTLLALS